MERNCDKCIHHTSGNCDSWDCKMQTVEDVKKEAVNEYVKAVVEELEIEMKKGNISIDFGEFRLFEIVKQGGVSDDVCEWNQIESSVGLKTYNISCCGKTLEMPASTARGLKYCTYCGKNIKAGVKNEQSI